MFKYLDVLFIVAPSPNPSMIDGFKYQGMPPLGVGYLATYLKKHNYHVKIIDMGLIQNTMSVVNDTVHKFKPRCIAISCTTETFNNAVRILKIIKKQNPEIVAIFGGPHVSFEYESVLLNNQEIDYIIFNEGERSLKKLCDYIIRKEGAIGTLKGIAYRNGNTAIICTEPEPFISDLDLLPFPDRTLFENLSEYAFPATISTSRGCPGQCIFCAASVLSGGKYRFRSARNIVDEFEYLKSLNYKHVIIVDDTLTASIKRLNSFLDELIERNLHMTWYCESRVDVINRDILVKMKSAGLTHIQFGVESGNQDVLNTIKKNITLDEIKQAFVWCRDIGIKASTNMIIGQHSDTISSINNTISLACELTAMNVRVSFTICTPFPGTPLWLHPNEFGITILDEDLDHYSTHHPVFSTNNLTQSQIRNEYYRAIKTVQKFTSNKKETLC